VRLRRNVVDRASIRRTGSSGMAFEMMGQVPKELGSQFADAMATTSRSPASSNGCVSAAAWSRRSERNTASTWLVAEIGETSHRLQCELARVFDPSGVLVPHTWLSEPDAKGG
jgi:hypothetical protein